MGRPFPGPQRAKLGARTADDLLGATVHMRWPNDTIPTSRQDRDRRIELPGLGWSITLVGAVIASLGGLTDRFELLGLGISLMFLAHLRSFARHRSRSTPSSTIESSTAYGRWSWNLQTGRAKSDGTFAAICGVATLDGTWPFEELLHRLSPADLGRLHAALENVLDRPGPIDTTIDVRNDFGSSTSVRLLGDVDVEDETTSRVFGVAIPCSNARVTDDLVEDTNAALERSLAEQSRTNDELVAIRARLESKNRELERARSAAVEATRYKSEFLANMSHEIRTPLSSIVGFADLVDGDLPPGERDRMLQAIRRNSEHLLSLVNDVLDLSRIEADRVELERIPTSPTEVVDDVFRMMKPRAEEKGLELALEVDGDLPDLVSLDPTRLRQILINLVGNAIKFTDQGGVVARLSYDVSNHRLEISVVDSGIGMSPRAIERIFEPFRQGDGSTTRRYGGTGLGLHISRRLCELLGGGLSVLSVPEGGSTFTATLHAPSIVRSQTPERSSEDLPTGLRVLLAEDGPDNRVLIEHLLKRLGVDVVSVENGRDAVNRVTRDPNTFDALILDMQMPVMDGWEAACQLRNAGCGIPILALTANALPGDRATCLEAGCDGFLTKPVRRKDLASGLVEVLAASRARHEGVRMAG